MNSIRKGNEQACDITIDDIEKCFDVLWVQECMNTLYENGLKMINLFSYMKKQEMQRLQ